MDLVGVFVPRPTVVPVHHNGTTIYYFFLFFLLGRSVKTGTVHSCRDGQFLGHHLGTCARTTWPINSVKSNGPCHSWVVQPMYPCWASPEGTSIRYSFNEQTRLIHSHLKYIQSPFLEIQYKCRYLYTYDHLLL
jgi:hypothetical protein